ncbi:MAG: hypothetical protein E4H30_02120 [Methanomassiliicoccus sp.]|nr:MAG: hypothetical protein E4H30_02120 [Methanomassiliicoccus sp.]
MWKVFGEEGVMVQFGSIWAERMKELSKRRKDRPRFLELLDQADISHYLDIHQKLHVFKMKLPETCNVDDVQFLKSFIQRIIKSVEYPMVELDDEEQMAALIITAVEPEDEHRERMSEWYKMKKAEDKKVEKD